MPTNDYLHVIDVRQSPAFGSSTRPLLLHWTDARDMDLADFPSGAALIVQQRRTLLGTLRLRLARAFDTSTFANSTDVEATVGMAPSMVDIPPYGAAWRLLSTREIARTNMAAQPEARHAEEVPAGHIASVATQLRQIRDTRIAEESFVLRERFPIRSF